MLNEKQTRIFRAARHALGSEGYEIRLVGGAVRDILQGKDPKDLDFATDAPPMDMNRIFNKYLIHTIPTGIKHGTITAIIEGENIEVTTLRVDVETDGRHAEVAFTDSWEKDAERRDLTINAMSMDFDGKVYDYFGGLEDLSAGKLRFVGHTATRVQEDFLRILRYFRFASHAEKLVWDYDTLDVLGMYAIGLPNISGERIWSEMMKILSGKNVYNVLYAMDSYNILLAIGLNNRLEFKTYWEFLRLADSNRPVSPLLYLATMLKNVDELDYLRADWKFDTNSYRILKYVIENRNNGVELRENDIVPMMLRGEDPQLMYLYAVYRNNWSIASMLEKYKNQPLPKFPVTGNDLKAVGIKPGPELGAKLTSLREAWISSGYQLTKQELLNVG